MPLIAQSPKPRVILGLMTFGTDTVAGARVTTVPEFGKVLDLFQSRGYNEVDTARMYIAGKQEAFTREAGWKDRGLTLATKVQYPTEGGMNTADKVLESAEISLKELGTDCVDILYLHAAVRYPPPLILLNGEGGRWDTDKKKNRTAKPPSPKPSPPSTTSTKPASSSASAFRISLPSRSPRSS